MKKESITVKIMAYAVICGSLLTWRSAHAFIWPVIDLSEVTSFAQTIASGINQVSNATSQLQQINKTITMVGDQVASVKKYATDLKNTITNIKDNVTTAFNDAKDTISNVEDRVDEIDSMLNSAQEAEKESSENLAENVENQIDSGASEEDVQETVDTAKEEAEARKDEVNSQLDEAGKEINDTLEQANSQIDAVMEETKNYPELGDEAKEELTQQAEEIKNEITSLKEEAAGIIADAKENYNEQYSEKIAAAFDDYSLAISDYYSGKITREGLTAAGEKFKESVASMDASIDQGTIDGLVAAAQQVADKLDTLKEDILDAVSDTGDYSDGSEKVSCLKKKVNKYYVFNFRSEHYPVWSTGIYAESSDNSFLLPAELGCDGLEVEDIEDSPDKFRACVVKAKAEQELYPNIYEENLYKPYKQNGIYKHILEDYSVANIVNVSKAKQTAATWSALEPDNDSNKGTLYVLRKTLKDVDNTRSAFSLMSMTDIEAPKIWSDIRRVDALSRAKDMIRDLSEDTNLYLDGRDSEFVQATNENRGTMQSSDLESEERDKNVEGKVIFPNVVLSICQLDAKDISVSAKNKSNATSIEEKEKNIADCLYKYAKGVSLGTDDSGGVGDQIKEEWRLKQKKAYNDAAFFNLFLAAVNTYKSSLDYMDPEDLPADYDRNIISMQDGIKESTTARDDYSAGAQMNYYTTMQILSLIDADAQNQQTEILKDLMTFDYTYFGQSEGGEG